MNKIWIALTGCIVCFSASVCFGEALMSQEEMDRLGERMQKAVIQRKHDACGTLGDSGAKGIELTREGCRLIYKTPRSGEDASAAVALLEEAIKHGEPSAKYYLGSALKKSDPQRAKKLLMEAAEFGVSKAQVALGHILMTEMEFAEAEKWWRIAADNGDLEAAVRLGGTMIIMSSENNDKRMEAQGCAYILTAARKGDYLAQRQMIGAWQDLFAQEFLWFLKEAESGNPKAYIMAGMMYEEGIEVEKDVHEAYKWYEKATNEGSWDGFFRLYILWERMKIRKKGLS